MLKAIPVREDCKAALERVQAIVKKFQCMKLQKY
jgi:hypothetical protein